MFEAAALIMQEADVIPGGAGEFERREENQRENTRGDRAADGFSPAPWRRFRIIEVVWIGRQPRGFHAEYFCRPCRG